MKKNTLDQMHFLAAQRGGICLSTRYHDSKTKLRWQCVKKHKPFIMRPNDVQQGHWCKACGQKNIKYSLKELQKMARDRGGELLSTEYRDNKTELLWRCTEGHEFLKRANTIQQGISWCAECNVRLREGFVRECFETIFNEEFPKARPHWLSKTGRRNMELDGYNSQLNLAFEHHGIQHYQTVPFFHNANKNLSRQRQIDLEKRELCKARGVTLVEVSYNIPSDKVYSFILDELDKAVFPYPDSAVGKAPAPETVHLKTEMARLKKSASRYGHTLQSQSYLGSDEPLVFRCTQGHTFPRSPSNFHRGQTNCPECIGVKPLTIEQMRDYAKKREGVCLSSSYTNNKTSLDWLCRKHNHRFSLPWNKIKSSGRWCKFCNKS